MTITTPWEADLAGLLNELSATQQELLAVLASKRQYLVTADLAGMKSLEPREQSLVERLQACYRQRGELLARAAAEGLPSDSVQSLSSALPGVGDTLARQLDEAGQRTRHLQHQSLTNWVIVQRTLLHLAQLLEIIATGGRARPTYGKGDSVNTTGSLVDQAA